MIRRFYLVFSYGISFLYNKIIGASQKAFDILYNAVSELGGIYVKLIQFLCLRTDIFSDKEKVQLLGFYDTVPVEHLDIREILNCELGTTAMSRFATLESHPFASGTFGQVYRGTLTDGTDIVVKILRPGIRPKLAFDFFVMKISVALFTLFYEQRLVDVRGLLAEFESLTYKELDYRQEAKNAQYFYDRYRGHPYVVIPKTFVNLTTKTLLVQEYVGGIPITEIIKHRDAFTGDLRVIIKRLSFEIGIQGFTGSYFYADPHPGNIKILPDGKFAFIDFGIVGESPKNRHTYYHIISEMIGSADSMNTKGVGELFLKWGSGGLYRHLNVLDDYFNNGNGTLKNLVINKYSSLLDNYRERFRAIEAIDNENFAQIYIDIVRAGELLGVKIPDGMLATMRTIAIAKSWTLYLEPDYHCMRDVYREVLAAVNKKYLIDEDQLSPKPASLEDAIETVLEWVGSVAEKDYAWYNAVRSNFGRVYA